MVYLAVLIIVLLGLPIAILLDSKRRRGKFSWGWAFVAFFVGGSFIGKDLNQIFPLVDSGDSAAITDMLGSAAGYFLGGFILYRLFTRGKSKNEQRKQIAGIPEQYRPHWETPEELPEDREER